MIAGQATADIDIDAAMQQYQHQCQSCHGLDGQAPLTEFPKLANQQATYLSKSLRDYQQGLTGPRPDPIMTPIALDLSPADRANLIAYLSTQAATNDAVNPQYLNLGQKLYRAGDVERHIPSCAACHGPAGRGNLEATYPQLAGQNKAYVLKQLQLFALDQRKSDPQGMMRDIAKRLNPQDQMAVASFISGLHD